MHLNEIISRFNGVKSIGENSYQVQCPAHKDDKASLTISEEDNKILMHCHAGCDLNNILNAIGLQEKDLFNNPPKDSKPKIVKEYYYTDEDNKPLYKVIRYEPKSFVQAKYDNGKWVYKMTGVRYVLYNLHNVSKSDEIYFVEGEKDADNLNSIGLVATTTVSGASSFSKRAKEYCELLKGKTVFIIPDNDNPGYKYAEDISKALEGIAKSTKILKLVDEVPDLKEKGDISDVLQKYGKEKTLEILKKLKENEKNTQKIVENEINLDKNNIFSPELFEKLYKKELNDIDDFFRIYSEIKEFCRVNRITGFDKNYKLYKEAKKDKYVYSPNVIVFPEINNNSPYNSGRYEISSDNFIYEIVPNVGKILVSYQPVIPICRYVNVEDGLEKIKIAFLVNDEWRTLIVDKSTISSSQAIIKLSDLGLEVTSENSKALVKYLAEIENLNKDIIKVHKSVSRMGWFGKQLLPYSNSLEFDNEKDIPKLREKFGESGKLEDWVEFYKERRKFNPISRIVMAAAVSSILLDRIKQTGFTLHIWGESEYGKTVACMVGQSIFGNPSQNDGKGIGINFNFTNVGLEYRLNLYNNIPLFVNEMQHQKDAKDYDKILFLVSEGKGKTRSTKIGGLAKENSWNNIVITNGEKNIMKSNSNAGAYNRCLSYEITKYSFKDLPGAADFAKENYGTPIREILKRLDEFDCKKLFNDYLKGINNDLTTNKQKILEAIILLGDKIVTDVLFKDGYYLSLEDIEKGVTNKKEIAVEERAFEYIKDWFVSEKRHFLSLDSRLETEEDTMRVEIYGKMTEDNYVAFIPTILKKKLEDGGFDYNEVLNAWRRKEYLKHSSNRNTISVRINGSVARCVLLNLNYNEDDEIEETNNDIQEDELPF